MINKWQKNIALGVIILVAILIVSKIAYNYFSNQVAWEEGDRETLVSNCLDDLASKAIRFPSQSVEYCGCTTDTLMGHFTKAEYLIINEKSFADQQEEMLPVVLDCYNVYQEAVFSSSTMD